MNPLLQPNRRRILNAGLGLGLAGLAPLAAQADEKFPVRPITLVVPFPPGGSVDIMARQYSEPLSRILGVPIVVENRAGAGGSVASLAVARAKPDGYTLVVSSQSSHLANPLTQPKVGYDPVKDFENIAILGRQPNALVVHASLPIKSVKEFVEYAKKNPGKLNYGSGGIGSMGQLNVEMFKAVTGVFTTHIPYRGGTPLITAVLANEVQFILDNPGPVNTILGDRVARSGAGCKAHVRSKVGTLQARATPQTAPDRATRREGPCRRATRRCAPCVCRSTRGVARLDWHTGQGLRDPQNSVGRP